MSPAKKHTFGKGGKPGNAGGGLKPVPREIELREEVYLHPETIADTLGTSASRVREWIEEGRLQSAFAWRSVPFVACGELERALLENGLEGPLPKRGKRPSSDIRQGEIARQAASQSVKTGAKKPERTAVARREPVPSVPDWYMADQPHAEKPDFSRTVSAKVPVPYTDGRRLPPLPGNWEKVIQSEPRLVKFVRLLWLEGLPTGEAVRQLGVSESTGRTLKKTALARFGI